jgi:hypothetical protein
MNPKTIPIAIGIGNRFVSSLRGIPPPRRYLIFYYNFTGHFFMAAAAKNDPICLKHHRGFVPAAAIILTVINLSARR